MQTGVAAQMTKELVKTKRGLNQPKGEEEGKDHEGQ